MSIGEHDSSNASCWCEECKAAGRTIVPHLKTQNRSIVLNGHVQMHAPDGEGEESGKPAEFKWANYDPMVSMITTVVRVLYLHGVKCMPAHCRMASRIYIAMKKLI